MLSLQQEYRELHAAGVIDDTVVAQRIAAEQGTTFSVCEVLRVSLYASVAAITAGLGIFLKTNIDRIGPLSIVMVLALVAVACYANAIRTHVRHETRSAVGEYILLLGALIASADLGYAESQFHWLGSHWSLHLLILFALHAGTAYALNSRLVLSVSIASLAAWFGIEGNVNGLLRGGNALPQSAVRAMLCAGVIYAWREGHRRLGAVQPFKELFEHYAANIAFWGALALCLSEDARVIGMVCLGALAIVTIRVGLLSGREIFVNYGVAYSALGLLYIETQVIDNVLLAAITELVTVTSAVALMWRLRRPAATIVP